MKRLILIVVGWSGVALGAAGLVLPLMPATPFFLIAAWCFVRSSPRFHHWLVTHPCFGTILSAYRERRGLTLKQKTSILTILWVTLALSALLCPIWWVRLILLAVGIGVTWHIARLKTQSSPVARAGVESCAPE